MFPRKSLSTALYQPAAVKRAKAHARRRARKGNSHAELTRSELEQMVFQAAQLRAAKARTGA